MIGDIIFILVHLATEFLNYLLAYVVIFGTGVSKKAVNWICGIVAVTGIHLLLLLLVGRDGSSALSLFSMVVIPLLLLRPMEKKNFLVYPFVAIETSVLSICISFLVAIFLGMSEAEILDSSFLFIVCQSFPIILMLGLYFYQKSRKLSEFQVELNWQQYIIFYIVAVCLFFLLSPLQVLSEMNVDRVYINHIGLSSSVACIVLIIVTIWQGIVINRDIRLKERNEMNEMYIALQKEYYEQLLNQDEKMRRFRHDMNAHIQMLNEYCNEGETEKIKAYLNVMMNESAIYAVQKYTGNRAVDAMLQPLVGEAESRRIIVEIRGELPQQTRIEDYDFCTIIYNLMKNAIEASELIEDVSQRVIRMEVGAYHTQIYISVKNQVGKKKALLLTTKEDKKNHGLGLGNVRKAVEKYNGLFHVKFEEGWFIAEVNI